MAFKDLFVKPTENKAIGGNDVSSILNSLPTAKTEVRVDLVEPIDGVQSVGELYERLGMATSNKIYDVSPFIDSLPSSLDMVSKKTTLAKILQAARHDIEELKINADECISALEQANIVTLQTTEQENDKRKSIIQSKLAEIKELELEIEDEVSRQTQQGILFNEEITKLKTIKGYLE